MHLFFHHLLSRTETYLKTAAGPQTKCSWGKTVFLHLQPRRVHALVRANCAHAVFAAAQRKLCIAALPFLPKSNPLRWASILIIKIFFAGNPFFGCMRVRVQASARSAERPFCRYSPQDFVGKRYAPFTVDSFFTVFRKGSDHFETAVFIRSGGRPDPSPSPRRSDYLRMRTMSDVTVPPFASVTTQRKR